jgi:hypothetical protein
MMRRWIVTALIAALAFPLVACADDERTQEPKAAKRVLPYLA